MGERASMMVTLDLDALDLKDGQRVWTLAAVGVGTPMPSTGMTRRST
jgi:hypothetical protein